jgi:hypothetical protein
MFKKDRKLHCEITECNNERPEPCAVIYVGDHAISVCEECERLMEVIEQKYTEAVEERFNHDEPI